MKKILNKFRYIAGFLSLTLILALGGCSAQDSQKFFEYTENPEYLQEILQPDEDILNDELLTEAETEEVSATEESKAVTTEKEIEEVPVAPSEDIVATEAEDNSSEYFYSFRTKELYDSHYEKHKNEFGKITKKEYLEMANSLINRQSDSVENKYDEDGDYMYYDVSTNEFLVLSKDGYIRTFFKPSAGIEYWNRQ